jgi:hypothetical protein
VHPERNGPLYITKFYDQNVSDKRIIGLGFFCDLSQHFKKDVLSGMFQLYFYPEHNALLYVRPALPLSLRRHFATYQRTAMTTAGYFDSYEKQIATDLIAMSNDPSRSVIKTLYRYNDFPLTNSIFSPTTLESSSGLPPGAEKVKPYANFVSMDGVFRLPTNADDSSDGEAQDAEDGTNMVLKWFIAHDEGQTPEGWRYFSAQKPSSKTKSEWTDLLAQADMGMSIMKLSGSNTGTK